MTRSKGTSKAPGPIDDEPADIFVCPRDISADGRRFWNSALSELQEPTTTDLLLLGTTCRWYATLCALQRQLAADPSDYKAITASAVASKHFASGASKLGLGPVDRGRLGEPPLRPENDPLELLRRDLI